MNKSEHVQKGQCPVQRGEGGSGPSTVGARVKWGEDKTRELWGMGLVVPCSYSCSALLA